MLSLTSFRRAPAIWQTSRSSRQMKPYRFMQVGAALMVALIFVGSAGAQVSGEDALLGSLDLRSSLSSSDLYSGGGSASSEEAGEENSALIRQTGQSNIVEVTQTGSAYGAWARVAQFGADNTVDVTQCACGNVVDVIQDGSENLSEISQTGAGNVFVHRQYGDALGLSVSQYGGAQISITQTGP